MAIEDNLPQLSAKQQAYVGLHEAYRKRIEVIKDLLRDQYSNTATKINQELRIELLQTENAWRRHYYDIGTKDVDLVGLAWQRTSDIPLIRSPESIAGYKYDNIGTRPFLDPEIPTSARATWELDLADGFNSKLNRVNEFFDQNRDTTTAIIRGIGSFLIDFPTWVPTPAKILPLPKTGVPGKDFLIEGNADEVIKKATGLKTPGDIIMEELLGAEKPFNYNPNDPIRKLWKGSMLDEDIARQTLWYAQLKAEAGGELSLNESSQVLSVSIPYADGAVQLDFVGAPGLLVHVGARLVIDGAVVAASPLGDPTAFVVATPDCQVKFILNPDGDIVATKVLTWNGTAVAEGAQEGMARTLIVNGITAQDILTNSTWMRGALNAQGGLTETPAGAFTPHGAQTSALDIDALQAGDTETLGELGQAFAPAPQAAGGPAVEGFKLNGASPFGNGLLYYTQDGNGAETVGAGGSAGNGAGAGAANGDLTESGWGNATHAGWLVPGAQAPTTGGTAGGTAGGTGSGTGSTGTSTTAQDAALAADIEPANAYAGGSSLDVVYAEETLTPFAPPPDFSVAINTGMGGAPVLVQGMGYLSLNGFTAAIGGNGVAIGRDDNLNGVPDQLAGNPNWTAGGSYNPYANVSADNWGSVGGYSGDWSDYAGAGGSGGTGGTSGTGGTGGTGGGTPYFTDPYGGGADAGQWDGGGWSVGWGVGDSGGESGGGGSWSFLPFLGK